MLLCSSRQDITVSARPSYVVEGRFAEATLTDDDRTLADAVEEIVKSEFTDLTPEDKAPKMKSKPVRSTAGKER